MCCKKAAMGNLGLPHFRAFINFGSSAAILNANISFFTIWISEQPNSNDECSINQAKYEKMYKPKKRGGVVGVVYRWSRKYYSFMGWDCCRAREKRAGAAVGK